MLVHTIDFFLQDVLRLPVQKALDPNDPHDFQLICQQLAKATAGLVQADEAKALKAALAALNVDWKKLNAAAKAKIVEASKKALNPVKSVLPKLEEHYEANALKLGVQTKGSVKKTFGFSIGTDLTTAQIESLQAVAFSQGNYVRDEYGKRSTVFGLKAKKIVAEELAKGSTQKEIAARLHSELSAQQFNRSRAYWGVVANAFANRARTFVNLSSYEEAGITEFGFESVLDEKTSQVCRFMHGRRFQVSAALGAFKKSENKKGDVKRHMPWVQQRLNDNGEPTLYVNQGKKEVELATVTESAMGQVDSTGKFNASVTAKDLEALGVMVPPLHGHCRSTIVPVLKPAVAAPAAPSFALTPPEPAPEAPPTPPPPPAAPPPEQDALDFPAGGIGNAPLFLHPEQQGFVFGPGGITMKPLEVPTPGPAAAPVKAYIPIGDKKKGALEKLEAVMATVDPDETDGLIPTPAEVKINSKVYAAKEKLLEAFAAGLGKKTPPKFISGMKVEQLDSMVDPVKVEEFINNPKLLSKEEVLIAKVGKELFVVKGHEALAAAHFLEKWKLPVQEINLKELETLLEEKAKTAASKPSAPAIPPKPVPAPSPPPPKPAVPLKGPVDPADVLHKKYGDAKGSNEGGFYEGKDGKKRYVKFYGDPAQAQGEALANALYKALGHEAPSAITFQHNGKHVYAAELLDGDTLGSKGVTKDNAREFFKGFAADILMANWDAAGASVDNAFALKNGKIVRIDNGGAFLMRAKAGRKPLDILNAITEIDTFFPGSGVYNPGYHKLAQSAGYSSVEDFKDDFKKQVAKISETRKFWGGWDNFVAQYAPGLSTTDRAAVVKMLEERNRLLEGKVAEIYAPPPPPPKPGEKPVIPPERRWSMANGATPKDKLKITDLPETPGPKPPPAGKMPWGESRTTFDKRERENLKKISADNKQGVVNFSGNSYGAIRDSELSGKPNEDAKRIQRAFQQGVPEPCTVVRAIRVPQSVAEEMIRVKGVFRLGQGNKASTSSSTWDPEVGMNWGGGTSDSPSDVKIKFIIHQRSGIGIDSISRNKGENEILLPAGAEFRLVKSARLQGRQRVILIELEEI